MTQPSSTTAGTFLNPVTVEATDQFGNAVANVTIGIAINPLSLSTGTTPLTTNAACEVVFSNLSEDVAGTYSLIASAEGLSNVTSNSFTITAAAADALFLSQPNSTTAGTILNPVTVQIADQFGNAVANAAIGIAISPGTLTTGTTPLRPTRRSGGLRQSVGKDHGHLHADRLIDGANQRFANEFTITAAGAASLTFITQPLSTTAGVTLNSVTVQCLDQFGNVVGSGVAIGISLSPGTLSGGTTSLTTMARARSPSIIWSRTTPAPIRSSPRRPASPTCHRTRSSSGPRRRPIWISTQPSNTTAGMTLNAVVVEAVDTFGNLVPGVAIGIGTTSGCSAPARRR